MQSHVSSLLGRRLFLLGGVVLAGSLLLYLMAALSQAQHENKIPNASAKVLAEIQAQKPEDLGVMYELAYRLERDGKNDDARIIMEKLVQKEPRNLTYWQGLARCAGESGHALDALDAYKKGYELDPQWAVGHFKRAEILAAAHLTTEAMQEYDQGKKLDPKADANIEPWARTLAAKGRDQDAWDLLTAGTSKIMLSDGCYELFTDLGIRLKRADQVYSIMEHRIGFTPSYPAEKFRVNQIRALLGDQPDAATLREAEPVALKIAESSERNPDYYALLGKIRGLRGNWAGAESALKAGLKWNGDHRRCLEELIEVYRRTGRPEQEKETWGLLRKATGETPELAALRRTAKSAPQDTAALLALAKALETAGKFGEAADTYENVLAIHPQDPTALAGRDTARRKALEQLDAAGIKTAAQPQQ